MASMEYFRWKLVSTALPRSCPSESGLDIYLFSGEIMHRDSLGYEQPIRPREVNWMTAGSGITHSERFEHARAVGDRLHGIQAWVALPAEFEETAPSFTHHAGADLPAWNDEPVSAGGEDLVRTLSSC